MLFLQYCGSALVFSAFYLNAYPYPDPDSGSRNECDPCRSMRIRILILIRLNMISISRVGGWPVQVGGGLVKGDDAAGGGESLGERQPDDEGGEHLLACRTPAPHVHLSTVLHHHHPATRNKSDTGLLIYPFLEKAAKHHQALLRIKEIAKLSVGLVYMY